MQDLAQVILDQKEALEVFNDYDPDILIIRRDKELEGLKAEISRLRMLLAACGPYIDCEDEELENLVKAELGV